MDNDFGKGAAAKLHSRQNSHMVDKGMSGVMKVHDAAQPGGTMSKTNNGFSLKGGVDALKANCRGAYKETR